MNNKNWSNIKEEIEWESEFEPRLFESGSSFMYGTNIDWLGKAVETLSGKNLEQYFRDHITGPLGMDSTWFIPPEHLKHRIVNYYHKDKDTYKDKDIYK